MVFPGSSYFHYEETEELICKFQHEIFEYFPLIFPGAICCRGDSRLAEQFEG
jgi:hypothetical protein